MVIFDLEQTSGGWRPTRTLTNYLSVTLEKLAELRVGVICERYTEMWYVLPFSRWVCFGCRSSFMHSGRLSGFLQVTENWKKSGNLSAQGKIRGKYFLEKSGRMKNWCYQMSDFQAKCIKFDFRWGSAPDPAGGAYSTPPDFILLHKWHVS